MQSHEVFVVKFGEVKSGKKSQYFLNHNGPAGCDDQPGQLDFCVWVVRTADADIVVDVGFTSRVAKRRDRPHFREPSEAVALLGVDVTKVSYVILSHLHYDHSGDLDPFTSARVVVQEDELRFWTGRHAWRPEFRRLVESEDLERVVRLNLEGRVDLVSGTVEIVPGVAVHQVGGHTPGTQIVTVETARGTVVLASDSSHLQSHAATGMPANLVTDLPAMYDAFETINLLASSPDLVIPGHDPEVLERFDAVPSLQGIAARIA